MEWHEILNTSEAAHELGVSAERVRALIDAKRLPGRKIGREWAIARVDLALVAQRPRGRPRRKPAPSVTLEPARSRQQNERRRDATGSVGMKRERIAALVGRKGGSGKTCTTMNLAGALMEQGLRVLAVDLDPQASLTRLLTTSRVERGVGNCIAHPDLPAADLIRPTNAGIHLLPGDRSIEIAGLELYDSPSGFHRLRRVLAPITGFDAVLLDTPPALGFALSSALLAAGWAIFPTAVIQQDLDALVDTLAVLDELRDNGMQCAEALAIVPNEVRRDSADQDGLATLHAAYGPLVAEGVPHAVAIKHALNGRMPLSAYAPKAPAMGAYRSLAGRLLAAIERERTHVQS